MVNELLGIQYNIAKANVTDRKVQNLASYININSLGQFIELWIRIRQVELIK